MIRLKKTAVMILLFTISFYSKSFAQPGTVRECISGISTICINQPAVFSIPNTYAQCSNCHDWDFDNSFTLVGSDQLNTVTLIPTQLGIFYINVNYLNESGCNNCSYRVEVVNCPPSCPNWSLDLDAVNNCEDTSGVLTLIVPDIDYSLVDKIRYTILWSDYTQQIDGSVLPNIPGLQFVTYNGVGQGNQIIYNNFSGIFIDPLHPDFTFDQCFKPMRIRFKVEIIFKDTSCSDLVYEETFVFSIKSANIINVYPNPIKDNLTIESGKEVSNWIMTNSFGKVYFKGNTTKIIDMSNLSNGIYFLKATLKDGKTVIKKIIKK